MEEKTKTFADSYIGNKIPPTNPMEESRRPTDKLFIFVFLLIVIAWLGACISWFRDDRVPKNIHDPFAENISTVEHMVDQWFSRFGIAIISLVLGTVGTLIGIFLNSKFISFFVYLGMGLYTLYQSIQILQCAFFLDYSLSSCLKPIVLIVCIGSLVKVDKHVLFDIIRDACRAIVRSPSIILFACLSSIVWFSVFLFTLKALLFYSKYSDRQQYYLSYNFVTMMLGGIHIMSFIFNFFIMVITNYTVDYYWKNASIEQTLTRVLRNHIGTIVFSSMIFLPFFCTLVQAFKHKQSRKNGENYFIYGASKLYLSFTMLWTAMTFSSIYGTDFLKSTKKAFDTLLSRCLLYLATITAVFAVFFINWMVILIYVRTSMTMMQARRTLQIDSEDFEIFYVILSVSVCTIATFALALYYSAEALLVNRIIILNKEDQCTEGKNEILNRL